MRDMGGTHITYLSFLLLSMVCWLLGTQTPQGRKLIVPFLHRQSSLLALRQSKVLLKTETLKRETLKGDK